MDECLTYLLEAQVAMEAYEPVDMVALLMESGDTESKKAENNAKVSKGALASIKKALTAIATAIKNFCKSLVSNFKKMFANNETREEFAEWEEILKATPELKHKKVTFLDFEKYKKMNAKACADFDKVAKASGTNDDDMARAQKQFEEAMDQEPPTKELELGDVVSALKGHAMGALQDTSKMLIDRASEAAADAGKLGIDMGADFAKDPHNAVTAAGYATLSHRAYATAYQKEARTEANWFQRAVKECRRNITDLGQFISTTGRQDEVSRIRHSASGKNLKGMILKSNTTGGIASAIMGAKNIDGRHLSSAERKAVAEQIEMQGGALYSKAGVTRQKNRAIRMGRNAVDTIGDLFTSFKGDVGR